MAAGKAPAVNDRALERYMAAYRRHGEIMRSRAVAGAGSP